MNSLTATVLKLFSEQTLRCLLSSSSKRFMFSPRFSNNVTAPREGMCDNQGVVLYQNNYNDSVIMAGHNDE